MRTIRKVVLFRLFFGGLLVLAFVGCPSTEDGNGEGQGEKCPELVNPPTLASEWVSYVDWDAATTVTIGAHEVSAENFHFMPDHVEFTAGEPYIFVMQSDADNEEKHYFHAPEFYASGATRKAQTVHAEYKAPYFDDFELLIGGELELFFVPVLRGEYDFICTITGHRELGMVGELHTTCGEGLSLDLEIAADFDQALATDARRSGSDLVWETVQTVTVTMVEDSETAFRFDPPDLTLTKDQAYILEINNPAGNSSKHYYTAAEFYKTLVTRKAQDSKAEIKVPYFKAIELKIGGTTQVFIVPTVVGTYGVLCTIEGHSAAGMEGTITVVE